ncbi:MAG: site-specific DNA-methyltransferase [Defluviitaleaceae bacterium]|nr:site-specific DNA-methyltransferase [Defluviitaleaceae bacterium]
MPIKKSKSDIQMILPLSNNKTISVSDSILYENLFIRDTTPRYCHQNGLLFTADSIEWLRHIKDESIDLIFSDPPYNIAKSDWDKFDSQEKYIEWSLLWIEKASRILKPSGSLYICGFSEILADLKHPSMRYFKGCKWLIWSYKNKANLGSDWGRSHESILHLRKSKSYKINVDAVRIPYGAHTLKYPSHPQAETSQYGNGKRPSDLWTPHPNGAKPKDVFEIPVICNGMLEKTKHPTQKPEELLRKILLASSNENDIILDPFSGSGTSLVVAEQLGRKWIGCDINDEYNKWAIDRVENVIYRSVDDWIEFDKANAKRRESIR